MKKAPVVRITKEFKFEMAHALKGYDGPCRNIHGHSYELLVTLSGTPITDENNPKLGMIMDFGDLKKIVREAVIDEFDHACVLNEKMPAKLIVELREHFEKIILLPYQPTSELMIVDMAERIKGKLPSELKLKYLLLRETVTSYAEWFEEDNG
ncbi:MAG: 6-carboxytetrahydropterin synthase [Bacteroidales bacterium]|jgi:6-pyruvoyltetrahydropterin/6-carboxytetrahydropterin synthase|nr:6-carboxytetrahydropterin synthase [Bacteroidales bacterium]